MWAFRTFPGKIEYTPDGEDRPTYQVEVFGYLNLTGGIYTDVSLVAFRENSFWLAGHNEIGGIQFLPVDEFEKRFTKFSLVEE